MKLLQVSLDALIAMYYNCTDADVITCVVTSCHGYGRNVSWTEQGVSTLEDGVVMLLL